ncbi:chorismate lyase [Vibrio ostreicida]|uniref:Probable chorismate pyruvate-lyase n=1 Tax=Vibrio ostreicida TaxID=526588 RepID=A0ABT8BPH7_9VIBR|nr:chorismate lyase [Vibrio ostreicida]MDN3608791.1 chorismate lyase [Vibrio ostreicida]NPD10774.1 chorismate lyase [Vibrio ostreicida]
MNQFTSLYLSALRQVEWQEPDKFSFPTQNTKDWLLEQGSLSRLLETHCQTLSVDLLHNKVIKAERLNSQEILLLKREECLLRKVVLKGDDQAWVLGRTLIPKSSMCGQSFDLSRQGEVPLGVTIFSAEKVVRDALVVGWAKTPEGNFLARRSRLWMDDKPMLVAELFLPASPMFFGEKV